MTTPLNIDNNSGSLYTPMSFYFTYETGQTITPSVMIENVYAVNPSITIVETLSSGTYYGVYTPTAPGRTIVLFNGTILANLNVVARNAYSFLQNIEDECLGSWTWDKVGNTLTLLRQNGSPLTSFNVVENLTTASREIIVG